MLRTDAAVALDAMTDVLFVCLGNICRSPLMEGIVRARWLAQTGSPMVAFDSAGIGHWHAGAPPDPRAIAAAHRQGIDISGQRARVLADEDFRRFDLILCADRYNLDVLRQRAGNARAECALFLDWSGVHPGGEIPDPYTGTAEDFDAVFALIDRGAAAMIERLRRLPAVNPA